MLSYGMGDSGTGLASAQFGFYLFPFFTCAAGLPPWIASSILMIIKLWDAINDPLIGWMSDHTKSRWGPRLPWMIGASLPLGIFLAAMWWIPNDYTIKEKTTYYICTSILFMTAYTSVNLPYGALATELSEDENLRTRLNAARFTGSILASLFGLIVGAICLTKGDEGYLSMGRISGTIVTLITLLSTWGLAPFAKIARQPINKIQPIKNQFQRIFNNKIFIKVIYLYLLLWCGLQLMQTVSLIYLQQVMNVPRGISFWIIIPFQISALLGLQVWSFYANKYGRINALKRGGAIWMTGCLIAMILPPLSNNFEIYIFNLDFIKMSVLFITILFVGFGASTAYLIPWSLLPDAIDNDPEKAAGIYTAWMVLCQKLGIALSVGLFGYLLTFTGFKEGACQEMIDITQPDSALLTVRICMGLIPSILVYWGLLIMRDWKDRDESQQIKI